MLKTIACLLAAIGLASGMALAQRAVGKAERIPHNEAVIQWAVPEDFRDSHAVGDPFLVTYQVQGQAPGQQSWVLLGTTTQNWFRAQGLQAGRWAFRVQVLVDGEPLGGPSAAAEKVVTPSAPAPQPRRPQARALAVVVN